MINCLLTLAPREQGLVNAPLGILQSNFPKRCKEVGFLKRRE